MASNLSDAAHAHANSGAEQRREERRDCSLTAQLRTAKGESPCTVVNLSPGGLGLVSDSGVRLAIAERIVVSVRELGSIDASVRWSAHPRYGLEIADRNQLPESFRKLYASLSGERILLERMEFVRLDLEACDRIRSLKEHVLRELPVGLDKFYDRLRQAPAVRGFFSNDSHIARAKAAQLEHWSAISSGNFDERYYAKVRRIGETHARIGLEPRWYIGGYSLIAEHLVRSIIAELWPRKLISRGSKDDGEKVGAAVAALMKAIFLDMDIAISIYLDTAEEARLKGEAEALAIERKLVADSIGLALSKLANKDLKHRMQEELPEAYRSLQDDFNVAIENLEQALKGVDATADSVHAGMREVSIAAHDLSRRTEQQAASLEQTTAALNEITGTVRKTADGARQAQGVIDGARRDAEQSGEIVRRTVDAIAKISKSSQDIGQIIGVVDEIAFQTNLLALNAGVEAARAGDVGRGFAVVAAEVRALAQRSADAAKEIKRLIAASTTQVGDGVVLVAEAGKALERIAEQVTAINSVMSEIATSAQEQSVGLQEVNTAVAHMDGITQQNAAMAEEATAASESLLQESERLAALVGQFDISRAPTRPRTEAAQKAAIGAPASRSDEPRRARRQAVAGGRRASVAASSDNDWTEF